MPHRTAPDISPERPAMALSLYPDNEPQQKLRIQRFFMSASMYALTALPVGLSVLAGITPRYVFSIWALLVVAANAVFFMLLRCGVNKRFQDPSLTAAQILVAIPIFLFAQIYAGGGRGAYLVVLVIAFVFGAFRLRTRTLIELSLVAIAGYAATIPLIRLVEGERFNLVVELLLWLTLALSLPALSVLAGNISRLRRRLEISNARLHELLGKLTELATRDDLTGVYNRRYILEMMQHEKNRAARGGSTFCICLLDLDFFKRINDDYGHHCGDQVLHTFARYVATSQRDTDMFARYGGEEFLLFLPQTRLPFAEACAERIRSATAQMRFEGLPTEVNVTVSAGIAEHRAQEEISHLLERADEALYRAKRSGRNRVETAP
jgi:diguanylate cyclase (GGDEF)-like protein